MSHISWNDRNMLADKGPKGPEEMSKLAIITLSVLMFRDKISSVKEKESLIMKELEEIGVRIGMKNLAILYE